MSKKKIVYMGMSADIIHPGHLNIIDKASKYGLVIVGVLTDKAIASYKRVPFMNFKDRKNIVENLKKVFKVIPQNSLDYSKNLREIRPDYVVHGDDWKKGAQKTTREKVIKLIKSWGGTLIEVPYYKGYSSTVLNEKLKNHGITNDIRRSSLKRILSVKKTSIFMEAHNGLSGSIVENIKHGNKQFDGIWLNSLTESIAKAKPDIEVFDLTSRLNTVNEVLEVTTKPIIYDADTGGNIEHLKINLKTLERYGVSAIIIEDKLGPQQNSLLGTNVRENQDTIDNFCNKINEAKNSKLTRDFMIIARIESLILNKGQKDAITRAKRYLKAGADGIMIHSHKKDPNEIFSFCKSYQKFTFKKPLVVAPTSFNQVYEKELQSIGVNIIIYTNQMLRSAYPSMLNTAYSILKNSRSKEVDDNLSNIKEITKLISGIK